MTMASMTVTAAIAITIDHDYNSDDHEHVHVHDIDQEVENSDRQGHFVEVKFCKTQNMQFDLIEWENFSC